MGKINEYNKKIIKTTKYNIVNILNLDGNKSIYITPNEFYGINIKFEHNAPKHNTNNQRFTLSSSNIL